MWRVLAVVVFVGCRGTDPAPSRAKDPVLRVSQLQPDVVKVRRLALRQPVVAAMQSTSNFRAFNLAIYMR